MDAGGTSENRSLPTISDPGTRDDYSNGNNLELKKKKKRKIRRGIWFIEMCILYVI